MSATLSATRSNIRRRFRSSPGGNPLFGAEQIDQTINDVLLEFSAMDGIGRTWSAGIITLVASDYDYSLAAEYFGVFTLTRRQDGAPVERISPDRLLRERNPNATGGLPERYALYETTGQALTVLIDPTPGSSVAGQLLDGFVQTVPTAVSADSDTIPLGRLALAALELRAAGLLVPLLTPDELDRARITGAVVDGWMRQSEGLLAREVARLANVQTQDQITLREV